MSKRYTGILLLFLVTVLAPGCTKWLDVQPTDKFTETQVFSDLTGASTALNGMYLHLTGPGLYGRSLTMTTVEILAQRYNIGNAHDYYNYQNYLYAEGNVKGNFSLIWENAYVLIVNANAYIANLDKYKGNIPLAADSVLRGEAIGLRAMMHFDILRLFGPIYNTKDSVAKSIPYYRKAQTAIAELLPANQVIDSVLNDLALAETYLQSDPIRSGGVVKNIQNDGHDFWRNRNQRINYYAIKALQARAHLYRNNKPAALEAARAVVEGGAQWFPWTPPGRFVTDRANPDRTLSSELLFCLFNINQYASHDVLFASDIPEDEILAPNDGRLKTTYESNESDYRYNSWWILASTGGKSFRTFFKYADVIVADSLFRYKTPMIRLSELYYIMAECEPDAAKGRAYINTVRKNRGLPDLAATAVVNTELQKEYQKEFYGEGQLFFYYKRRNVTSIPNSAATSGTVSMNAAKYVLPLPLSETQYR